MEETAYGFDRSSRDRRIAADPLEGLVNGVIPKNRGILRFVAVLAAKRRAEKAANWPGSGA
jgi:hypothetical protein